MALLLALSAWGRADEALAAPNESTLAPKKIAAIVTVYRPNSHADVIVSRLLKTDTLDGQGRSYPMKLASLYTDQVPENDLSRKYAAEHGFSIYDSVAEALTLGTGKLAVDGVLLIAEHGTYPLSPTGNIEYPKRRLFEQVAQVFEASGRSVPVFLDKHFADNWTDAKWIYDTARRLHVPLMAGSSVPVTWRRPAADVERDSDLKEIVAVSYHTLTAYGFHALELAQALAERRKGGETGISAVQLLSGDAVWEAGEKGIYDTKLLNAAMSQLEKPRLKGRPLREVARDPTLCIVEYSDGLRVNILTLNRAVVEWAAAWRYADGRTDSTLFWTQEKQPYMHFTYLLNGFEQMMLTGKPAWPAERTLLTSGTLDALLQSQKQDGRRIETPYLGLSYKTAWDWKQPPVPEENAPVTGQGN